MSEEELTNGELTRTLIRIERKLDEVTGDHERRIRDLEQHNASLRGSLRGWMIGATSAGGVGALSGLAALFGG